MRNKYTELSNQLQNNAFNRPIYLHSEESSHDLKGEIYAIVNTEFISFNSALSKSPHWCDAMLLNLNVKYCHKSGSTLSLNLGKKYPQALIDTYRIDFKYQDIVSTPNYFSTEYDANIGPLGTSDYRILIEAIPLEDQRTFLHFTYRYSFGLAGRLAMQTYFSTLGRGKVGFTVIGREPDHQAIYIQGIRGVVERNTMRFYLAIEAYLNSLSSPVDQQLQKSLEYWYASSEQYARQLHEIERDEYIEMKHQEYQRQQQAW